MNIIDHLKQAEGFRAHPYDDVGSVSIGYGRNLSSLGISEEEAEQMLLHDIARVQRELQEFDWYEGLSETRKMACVGLVFNMGITRFRKFKMCILALSEGRWTDAADEIHPNSLYAKQVPDRASKYASWIATDVFEI
tara:strand:+ start:209 stop:619 length:411 start_codon:yes stop_codon:yes gene_type:complete